MGTRVPAGAGAGTAVPTEADADKHIEVDELLSSVEDLARSLDGAKFDEAYAQTDENARMLRSACRSDFNNLERELKECQEKYKEMIDKTKAETIADDELKALQSKLEEKLQEEKQLRLDFRAVREELDALERQKVSIEERVAAIRRKEKALRKAQKTLSMYVSVTKIMPNLDNQDKIAGYIIDKNKMKMETFEFEKTESPVEICNELWKKI